MSKKPVNFYQGAKGTYIVNLKYNSVLSDGVIHEWYTPDKSRASILESVNEGFYPIFVFVDDVLTRIKIYLYLQQINKFGYNLTIGNHYVVFGDDGDDENGLPMFVRESDDSGEEDTLIVSYVYWTDDDVLDKTFNQIADAADRGPVIMYSFDGNVSKLYYLSCVDSDTLRLTFIGGQNGTTSCIVFVASNGNSYPHP